MRLYTFTHCYLSSIQNGIQTSHVQGEITNFAFDEKNLMYHPDKFRMIQNWSLNHKTIINCNGGNSACLKDYVEFFNHINNPYPWGVFREDEDSMEGMLTGVGIILPEDIYEVHSEMVYKEGKFSSASRERVKIYVHNVDPSIIYDDQDSYIYQLIDRIKSARLAQ
jgi:hypothetical protein